MTNAFYELPLPQDSALTAPRIETERLPETLAGQIYIRKFTLLGRLRVNTTTRGTTALMESKLSDAQGQYFFWEPVNNNIPETGLSQGKTHP